MKAERRASARPRTGARVAAVQALFQSEHTGESVETVADQFIRHRIGAPTGPIEFEEGGVPEAHIPLFQAILKQVAAHAEVADAAIMDCLQKGWTLDRLDPVLRALLRAATGELMQEHEPPARVVINEYLDIAAGFLDEEATRYANGMLDTLAHRLRPADFAPGA